MSDIVILRAALEALNRADNQKTETPRPARDSAGWSGKASSSDERGPTTPLPSASAAMADRSSLIPEMVQDARMGTAGDDDCAIYYDDDLDSESVRLLALKAQQQLSIQALAIANVRALSIIGLFRDDDPPIRLM